MAKAAAKQEQYVMLEKEGEIARITLNNPAKLNAFKVEDLHTLTRQIRALWSDDDVKVIVLKGAGRAFCVGHDLSEVGRVYGWQDPKPGEKVHEPLQRTRLTIDRLWFEVYESIFTSMKPIIAQVHGYCLAGGFYMALMSDITICSEDAKFAMPEQRFAFGGGCQPALPILISQLGYKKARELSLTGSQIDGIEAVRIGLANKAVPLAQLDAEVDKLAKTICLIPADALSMGKAFCHLSQESLGMLAGFVQGYIGHTFGTNQKLDPKEFNFFKERRDKGTKEAFHERDARYEKIK